MTEGRSLTGWEATSRVSRISRRGILEGYLRHWSQDTQLITARCCFVLLYILHVSILLGHLQGVTISIYINWPNIIQRTTLLDCVWNVMAHGQKPHFVFRRNERVHLNRRGHQFSRLMAGEVCASAVVMLDTPCSEIVWRVLATHSIRQFPLHFPSRATPCAITFQLDNTNFTHYNVVN
jgi:hypothetical protein